MLYKPTPLLSLHAFFLDLLVLSPMTLFLYFFDYFPAKIAALPAAH